MPDISEVKVAVIYERLNDDRPKRTIEEHIQILRDTNADLVLRAWWRWHPLFNSLDDVPPEMRSEAEVTGYTFEQLKDTVGRIKQALPRLIVIGAVPAQKIERRMELDELTGETFDEAQTWAMALDPAKWGIASPTKDELQAQLQALYAANGYYPDLTNPTVQQLILSWIRKQIDAGMDGIWIDLLYTQANLFRGITGDVVHPAVRESYEAASRIVDEVHAWSSSLGRRVYVGTWSLGGYPYAAPALDFVTSTPTSAEILAMRMNDAAWTAKKENIEQTFGPVPVFVFIDWADNGSPMSTFSQMLSGEEQSEFLGIADDTLASHGMVFTYPVHGGTLGSAATILSYGQYGWYDAQAPEFRTYETIKALGQAKE